MQIVLGFQYHDTKTFITGAVRVMYNHLRIGCSTTSGKYLLPGLIARFRQRFPQVRINVLVGSRESTLNKLLTGQVALGVSSKRIEP